MDKLVSISQAADMLGVSQKIMRIWDDAGKVEAVRTAGGHRRYRRSEIEKLQGIVPEEAVKVEEKICLYNLWLQNSFDNHFQNPDKISGIFLRSDTILLCMSVDTLRSWKDKSVLELVQSLDGDTANEIINGA